MAFDREQSKVPSSVGEIKVRLEDKDGTTDNMRGSVQIDVLDAAGNIMRDPTYDLRDKGTAAIKTSLVSLLNAIRAQAASEVL